MRELGLGAAKPRPAAAAAGDKKAVAAAALAAAKSAASVTAAQQYGKVVVTETRRFAGKDVTVKREVAAGSKEAQMAATAPPAAAGGEPGAAPAQDGDAATAAAAKKKAGLDAVLASLAQPKKVGALCCAAFIVYCSHCDDAGCSMAEHRGMTRGISLASIAGAGLCCRDREGQGGNLTGSRIIDAVRIARNACLCSAG